MLYDRVKYTLIYIDEEFIVEEPIGWNDESRTWIKNKELHGMAVELTRELTFYLLGFNVISKAFYSDGVNAEVFLIKSEKIGLSNEWVETYRGYLDFTTYVMLDDNASIKMNGMPLINLYKNNADKETSFNVDKRFDGSDRGIIDKLDKVTITSKSQIRINKLVQDKHETGTDTLEYGASGAIRSHVMPLNVGFVDGFTNPDADATEVDAFDNITSTPSLNGIYRSFWKQSSSNKTLDIIINVDFDGYIGASEKVKDLFYRLRLVTYDQDGNAVSSRTLLDSSSSLLTELGGTVVYKKTFTEKINVLKNQSLALEHLYGAKFDSMWSKTLLFKVKSGTASIDITSVNTVEASKHDFITFNNALKCAVDVALNSNFKSHLLTSTNWNGLGILNGFMIRQYDPAESEFKFPQFSIKSLVDSINSIMPIGVSITDEIILEDISYFYQNFVFQDIGIVQDLKITVDKGSLFKEIKTGYSTYQSIEDGGTLQEYNSQSTWLTQINNVSTSKSLLNPYRADGDGIDVIRHFIGSKNDSEKNDQKIWILDTKESGVEWKTINWEGYFEQAPVGVFDADNLINLRLSPANILSRQLKYLGGAIAMINDRLLKFTTSAMSVNLSTQLIDREVIVESEDFNFISGDNYNIGLKVSFRTYNRIENIDKRTNNVPNYYGLLQLTSNNVTYFVYIDKMTRDKKGTIIEGTIKKILR